MINIEDFQKLEIKIGLIVSAEKVDGSDKLLKLKVNLGDNVVTLSEDSLEQKTSADLRQIISGIAAYYPDPAVLCGKRCAFIANLEPRKIFGMESQGMILAVSGEGFFSLLETSGDVLPGSRVR
jgi:tRNA-binding EMAP/Myf-like protein